jgi:putative transposase
MGLQVPRCVRVQATTEAIFGQTRRQLGAIFHSLARQKECQIIEGHLMPDHVHMCIAIPPKHPVASVSGFLKGKSAIAIPSVR